MRHGFASGVVALVLAVVSSAPAQEPPPRRPFATPDTPRQAGRIREADIKHLRAELTLDPAKKSVRGTVTHTLTPLHPYLTSVSFDIGPKLKVSRVTAGPDGAECHHEIRKEKLAVTLDKPYGPGDTVEVRIDYEGQPQTGLHFVPADPAYPDRPAAIWTQGEAEDNHHWLPCYDYPNDRVTTEMVITVPRPLSVVSNGSLVGTKENPDGSRTFHWKMEQPHSTYLITVAVADFVAFHDRVGELPVDYYVTRNVDEATARRFMGKTPQMIRFFNEKTGQPYPYPKYAQVCLPEFGGGMENTSATSMTDQALLDEIQALERDEDGLVAHELAHQWFGDLLTCKDWSHIWLNEGFASYFDPLFAQHDRGEDEFRLRMNQEREGYLANDRRYRRPIVETRYRSPMQMFDGMTYAKGGCVLHMLRAQVGEEKWWKGIQLYVARHKFQVVETDDLRKAMEEASGQDLKWFFDQWLHKAGHPELKARWHYEPADQTVRLKVEQTQKVDDQTPLFRLPTTIELAEASGTSRTVPVVIDGASQEFVIPAPTKPASVRIDPDCRLIKELTFEKPVAEWVFDLEPAPCVVCRIHAAGMLAREHRGEPIAQKALEACWKREKSVGARTRMVELLAGVERSPRRGRGGPNQASKPADESDDVFRTALVEAAKDPEARVRVAAIRGLARLRHDATAEETLRAAWSNPREAYGARTAALRALADWKVKDAKDLLARALEDSTGKHRLASEALEILTRESDSQARELVAGYARRGQPQALRGVAIDALGRLAKDDPALQDLIIPMIDDPDRNVRFRAWGLASSLKVKKALPALEDRLAREGGTGSSEGFIGFGAFTPRSVLQNAIKALKEPDSPAATTPPTGPAPARPAAAAPAAAPSAPSLPLGELEKQAEELENRARELRKRIEALKPAAK
ncbi:MAG: M1 family aminopeptidase [Isosphaeraceae bacterium]